jgi:hypothetical protein
MKKPGEEGRPTNKDFKEAAKTAKKWGSMLCLMNFKD